MPRRVVAFDHSDTYLFACRFDEASDEYSASYEVYRLPDLDPSELAGSWEGLEGRALERLGQVPVSELQFDETLRQRIDLDPIDRRFKSK